MRYFFYVWRSWDKCCNGLISRFISLVDSHGDCRMLNVPLNRVANRVHWELTASGGPAPAPQTRERRASLIQLTCLCKASVRCCTVYTALYSVLYCQTQPRIHYASLHNTRTVLINKLTRCGSKNGIAYWTKQFTVPCNLYLFVLTSFNLGNWQCLVVRSGQNLPLRNL